MAKNILYSVAIPVKGTTKIVGIFGDPVIYTLSPHMHNFALSKLKLDYIYIPFLVKPKGLKNAVESLRSLNLAGVNITIPHKKNVIPYLDSLSPLAKKIGAVNTIVNKNGHLTGHNTDATGFISSLKEDGKFNPRSKKVVMMGAGGVAHAMTVALIESGIRELIIFDKFQKAADTLCRHLKKSYKNTKIQSTVLSSKTLIKEMKECDLFVNATPCEISSKFLKISLEQFLSSKTFVFDRS